MAGEVYRDCWGRMHSSNADPRPQTHRRGRCHAFLMPVWQLHGLSVNNMVSMTFTTFCKYILISNCCWKRNFESSDEGSIYLCIIQDHLKFLIDNHHVKYNCTERQPFGSNLLPNSLEKHLKGRPSPKKCYFLL